MDLGKSFPLTLIFGLITQAGAIVWTVSMMMSDIERNRLDLDTMLVRVGKIEDMVYSQAVSVARIDENIKAIRSSVESMALKKD
jgi:hypothetical protein